VKKQRLALLFACLLIIPAATTSAQDFGIMESAETINKGNFKLRANPMLLFGRHGGDSDIGVAAVLGYGFTPRFDLEGGVAIYDGVTFFGANGEYWVLKHAPIDFSIAFGVHRRVGDLTADYNGIDLTFLPGGHVSPKLEVYFGLDMAFEGLGVPGDFQTVHLVPGLEYKVNDSIDLLAELGLGLNDSSRHYLSGGIAIYFR
jgi:uncharacterized protein YneR